MTIGFTEVVARCSASEGELEEWIALAWVRPQREGDDESWMFTEADVARIELICDLVHEMAIERDAVEVILPLVDRLYALRRELRALTRALEILPDEMRAEVLERLERDRR